MIALYNAYARKAIGLLAGFCALLVFLYGALLLLTVSHAARADAAQERVTAIAREISALEEQRLELQKKLTPALAEELGFAAPRASTVVYAKQESFSLIGVYGR